jgi:hypothetical protein
MPIATGRQPTDDRAMAIHPATELPNGAIDDESLTVLAGRLAEAAHAFREAAANPSRVDDVESVAAAMTGAFGDLAVGAELTANGVIDAERSGRLSRTGVTPSPRARAVSWRLHAVGSALRAARDACAAVSPVDGHSRGGGGMG